MQQQILAKHPSANLRVYVVWFNMLWTDSRSGWDACAIPDPRVTHLWDDKRVAGQWFSQQIWGEQGFMWDTYLLYGPEAKWDSAPAPLVSSGSTVVDKSGELRDKILPLLDR